jgi:hypothetical protein
MINHCTLPVVIIDTEAYSFEKFIKIKYVFETIAPVFKPIDKLDYEKIVLKSSI